MSDKRSWSDETVRGLRAANAELRAENEHMTQVIESYQAADDEMARHRQFYVDAHNAADKRAAEIADLRAENERLRAELAAAPKLVKMPLRDELLFDEEPPGE